MSQTKISLSLKDPEPYSVVPGQLSSIIRCFKRTFFAAANVTGGGIKQKRSCAKGDRKKSTKEKSHSSPLSKRSEDAEGYRWRGRRTLGEINSARPYLAAAPCWLSAEHAVLRKKPLSHALRHSMSFPAAESGSREVYFGLFRSAFRPASPSSCVDRDRPGQHRGRTEPCGECCAEWMNAAETERLAPLPLAQTLPRRPVGRPQLP